MIVTQLTAKNGRQLPPRLSNCANGSSLSVQTPRASPTLDVFRFLRDIASSDGGSAKGRQRREPGIEGPQPRGR
jgi:hypothetical protein